jgi:hypothetical protein
MTLYVLVDMTPNDDNLYRVESIEERTTKPPMFNDHRWLTESDLAEGATANIGLYWTGGLPAVFVEKPDPVIPADAPATQTEALNQALDALEAARVAVEQALAKG